VSGCRFHTRETTTIPYSFFELIAFDTFTYLETRSFVAGVVEPGVEAGKPVDVVLIFASDFGIVFFFGCQHY
jgi:hypothetical protein